MTNLSPYEVALTLTPQPVLPMNVKVVLVFPNMVPYGDVELQLLSTLTNGHVGFKYDAGIPLRGRLFLPDDSVVPRKTMLIRSAKISVL